MENFFNKAKPEKASNIIQASSNTEIEQANNSKEKVSTKGNNEETISIPAKNSKFPFSLSQLAVLGVFTVLIFVTLLLSTRGSHFCVVSICNESLDSNSIASNFWSSVGGLGAFFILSSIGISAPIAIVGGLAAWFLMQISL